jgi:hypothetical protein
MIIKQKISQAMFPFRLTAGLGMVLLAVVWSIGWMTAPRDLYTHNPQPALLLSLTSIVLIIWNLVSCVIAAGFFHAASKHAAHTFKSYLNASLRLVIMGVIFVFPVPLMSAVLGSESVGRVLALVIMGMSIAAIVFGRARMKMIENRLYDIAKAEELNVLAPM